MDVTFKFVEFVPRPRKPGKWNDGPWNSRDIGTHRRHHRRRHRRCRGGNASYGSTTSRFNRTESTFVALSLCVVRETDRCLVISGAYRNFRTSSSKPWSRWYWPSFPCRSYGTIRCSRTKTSSSLSPPSSRLFSYWPWSTGTVTDSI